MNVISLSGLMRQVKKHPSTHEELVYWYRIARKAAWSRLEDVRKNFPSADQVGKVLVFDISHNAFRLITTGEFLTKRIFVKELLTHKEYDRREWMKWAKH